MWTSALAGLGFGLALIVAIGAQNAHVLRQGLRREHVGAVVAVCAASDFVLIVVGTAGVGGTIAASRTLTVVMTVLGAGVLLTYGALAARRAVRGGETLVVEPVPVAVGAAPRGATLVAVAAGAGDPATGAAPGGASLVAVGVGAGDPATEAATEAAVDAGAALPAATGDGRAVPERGGEGAAGATATGARPGGRVRLGTVVATTLALTWLNPHVYLDTVVLLGSVAAGHGDARWWFAAGACVGSVVWFTALGYGAALLRPVFARPAAWRVLDAVIAAVMATIATTLVLDLLT
ncbi:LysE/ArgO family amino acid transporter [Cellulomonas sp. B6]|uniref:LysE/ArgO family amino acid transporter n=1 Tax=Cellulomonas sp. B6 TaxID=1295626 RepID=UPI00073BE2EE|nr:LysE family transporter [Cellulomonas sp. B6]KSW17671.1 amino acid transporter [Cellulomonas sp. B6]